MPRTSSVVVIVLTVTAFYIMAVTPKGDTPTLALVPAVLAAWITFKLYRRG